MKRISFAITVFLIMVIFCTFVHHEGKNIIKNPAFEEDPKKDASWLMTSSDGNKSGMTEFIFDTLTKHSGRDSICIINKAPGFAQIQQEVPVKANVIYKMTCWIRMENVESGKTGVHISIANPYDDNDRLALVSLNGTNKTWKYVEQYIDTKGMGKFVLCLGLGDSLDLCSGTFWDSNRELMYLLIILAAAFLTRLFIAPLLEGLRGDINCWRYWSSTSSVNGIFDVYKNTELSQLKLTVNYPPVYIYVLYIIGKLASWFSLYTAPGIYILLLKLPAIFADIVTSYILFRYSKKHLSSRTGLLIAGVYAFNPVVLLNSAIWGQVDSFLTMFLLIGLIFIIEGKFAESSILWILSVLVKPQGIIILPVLFMELIRKRSIRIFLICFACAVGVLFVTVLPFIFSFGPLWIFKLLLETINGSDKASMNAFNLFAFLGANFKESNSILFILSYRNLGFIFIILIVSFVTVLNIRKKTSLVPVLSSLFLYSGVFVLSSGMHERYLFPVIAISLLAFIHKQDSKIMLIFLWFTLTGNVVWNESTEQFNADELRERLRDVDVCITGWGSSRFDGYVLEYAEKLRMLAHTGGSVAPVVSDNLYNRGIKVISGNWFYAESVAEGVVAYILTALRDIPFYNNEMQKGRWKDSDYNIEGLLEQTIGLVGFGMIAKSLVKMLEPFRTKIKVYSKHIKDETLTEYGMERATLKDIFSTCKIISIHASKRSDTYHMVDKELLELIPDGSLLVNTARGSIIDKTLKFSGEELKKYFELMSEGITV